MTTNIRQPHAALDADSRALKARKIEIMLELDKGESHLCLLEVGCGSGGISHYFGTHPSKRFDVHAVDVKDSRVVFDGYIFQTVADTNLPFPSAQFDAVISNHVIEHVGDEAAQLHHLQELRRVLKPGGIGYLAVPNRWMLVEPHYKLAFLSWLPRNWRNSYLHRMRGVPFYDCKPLEMAELERILAQSDFEFQNISVLGIRAIFAIEGKKSLLQRAVSALPNSVLQCLNPVNPTLIYKLNGI